MVKKDPSFFNTKHLSIYRGQCQGLLSQIYRTGREKCFQTSERKPHAGSEEPVPVAAEARAGTSC